MPANTRCRSVLLLSVPAIAMASAAHAQGYLYRTVAKTGQNAPGAIGSYTTFGQPSLSDDGTVGFMGYTSGLVGNRGLWTTASANPQQIVALATEGMPVPGGPVGAQFGSFESIYNQVLLNSDGNAGFSAPITGMIGGDYGIFRRVGGAVAAVALEGGAVPSAGAGVTFATVSNLIAFSEGDLAAFSGLLQGPGVNAGNDGVVCMQWFGGVNILIREGGAAPGLANTTFAVGPAAVPTMGPNGRVSVITALSGASATTWSLWSGWPGLLELVAKEGDPSPIGAPFRAVWDGGWNQRTTADGVCFAQDVDVGGSGVMGFWRYDGNALSTVAYEGQMGPIGPYQQLDRFSFSANGPGTVVFRANFGGAVPVATDSGLVRQHPGYPHLLLVREGDAAPGYWAGVEFDEFLTSFGLSLEDDNRVVFAQKVRGAGITEDNDRGLWMIDADGDVRLIVRKGQMFSTGGGPLRQVSGIRYDAGLGTHAGRRAATNVRSDVAFTLDFTDGTSAVVVAYLPPSCPGDVNHDGIVNFDDLLIVLAAWGTPAPIGDGGDADLDGDTDFDDLLVVLGNWGNACF